MKISASIYSSKDKSLASLTEELDAYKVNYFHVDCNDSPAVFDDIKEIRKFSKTPVDLHLITSTPENYYDLIAENSIELLTLQYENLKEKIAIPENIKSSLGLAIVSETDISVFDEYKDVFSFILFMTTTPGQSGGKFNKENFRKIREFRTKYPDKKIHVDGGINEELSFILRNMGVYSAVIGSYLFKGDFIGSAMLQLKSDDINSHYTVRDFMFELDEIPVLVNENITFLDVLNSIEEYKMGFTAITDSKGILQGIISNADIRRGIIKNYDNLNNIEVNSLINRDPAFIYDYENVTEVLAYIKTLTFPVLFFPVVDKDRKVVGTIKFNNLIKGEL
jgi:pentose-5-phosphate-3-epimerase/CBS domain-containing protein